MYRSTRLDIKVNASKAIIDGIALDGGLYIKDLEHLYQYNIERLNELSTLSYKELAIEILSKFLDDFTIEEIKDVINKSYDNSFEIDEIVKLKDINEKMSFLELYHGKTKAFKDVALQVLPNLLSVSKKKNNMSNDTIILTATSGDTGSAALSGFSTKDDVKMIVLYPYNGVSEIQEAQMLSFKNKYKKVIAVKGNFDDCQTLVKKAFNDKANEKYNLSSANSINIGRLIPQIVYYFYAYFKKCKLTEKINFVVPTGNFGNILAGYIAMKMGLPINKLICASNDNNVLDDFFRTKKYDKNRKFIKTISPSMDILISSNLERLLYYKYNDGKIVNDLMESLKTKGYYDVDVDFSEFYSSFVSEDETKKGIKEVYDKYKYLIDPHTSVAYCAYKNYTKESVDSTKTVILSTASPFKFSKTIAKSIGISYTNDFETIDKISQICGVEKSKEIENLKSINKINSDVWEKEEAYENICKLIGELYEI